MNTAANNLFVSANGAMNSALPTMNSSNYMNVVIIIGIVGLIVLAAVWLKYNSWSGSPWFSDQFGAPFHVWDWLPSLGSQVSISPMGALQAVDSPMPKTDAAAGIGPQGPKPTQTVDEKWCFVGEDMAGRWCVKVPTESACSPERFFRSRSECELTPASPLPLSVQKNGGAGATPLSSMLVK